MAYETEMEVEAQKANYLSLTGSGEQIFKLGSF